MDWGEYKALCDRPDYWSAWMINQCTQLLEGSDHAGARDVSAVLRAVAVPRSSPPRRPVRASGAGARRTPRVRGDATLPDAADERASRAAVRHRERSRACGGRGER